MQIVYMSVLNGGKFIYIWNVKITKRKYLHEEGNNVT